ncbi:MAG: phosphomethylpyrimidine synthase [Gammaproteobacteria bacterium RIFCSPHIGHO2_12_FULL_38_14]|nr:MAG: phosphomethylpyrimidine synthase [Gammaproteobacteria bacterium RIFCSPHIGHO2_12_FULL_38_14]
MTQMLQAIHGKTTDAMEIVSKQENIPLTEVKRLMACGQLIIPANPFHIRLNPIAIGRAAKVKINANLGTSQISSKTESELEKLQIATQFGADTVMDLSTGKEINETRMAMLSESIVPLGTVPIYQVYDQLKHLEQMQIDHLLEMIEHQAKQGVDYMTLHCGILKEHLPLVKKRLSGIVSRGGGLLAAWMHKTGKQNPLYTHYDAVLAILAKYDVTISLGDALRPGCIHDATDEAQIAELKTLGGLTKRAWERGVQVMVEGPGHIPLHEVEYNMQIQHELCHGAPFYVLGPLVVDCAAGYDHIASAIGAAVAGWKGASLLCYITPKEHLGLPNCEDVKQGVIAYKIAAHAANIARGDKRARERDAAIAKARVNFEWEKQFALTFDPETARKHHDESLAHDVFKEAKFCSMCGPKYCPMGLANNDQLI